MQLELNQLVLSGIVRIRFKLKEFKTCDIGDIELPMGDVKTSLDIIYKTTKNIKR